MIKSSEIEEIEDVLKPFSTATNDIRGDTYVISSIAVSIVSITKNVIKNMKAQRENLND